MPVLNNYGQHGDKMRIETDPPFRQIGCAKAWTSLDNWYS